MTQTSGSCANCGITEQTLRCARCHESPSADLKEVASVFYCGKDCQVKHWAEQHKDDCKAAQARTALKLFANTLQQALLILRKKTYDAPIIRIERVSPTVMHIHDGTADKVPPMNPGGHIWEIPPKIWEDLDEGDRAAVLTLDFCMESLAMLNGVIKALLTGKSNIHKLRSILISRL